MLTSDGLGYVKAGLFQWFVERDITQPIDQKELTEKILDLTEDAIIFYGVKEE